MHGFQRRSTVYPDFTEVHCFNRFEAEHARRRLPEANVVLVSNVVDTVQTRSRCVIAGVYGLPHSQEGCRSFIEWARGSKLPVIVKRHPRDRSIFWDGWKGTDGVEQLDEPIGFAEFLRTHQPRFMATWYSTTLLDALLMGIVPITFAATAPDADDVVFPFREVALRWPEDRATIRSLADDPVACDAFVRRLRAGILGVAEELQGPPPPAALS